MLCVPVLQKQPTLPHCAVTEFDGWCPLQILEALLIFLLQTLITQSLDQNMQAFYPCYKIHL